LFLLACSDDTITIPGNRVPFATQEERETADRISQRARTPPLVVELEDSADAYNKEMAELLNKSKPFVLLSVWKKMQSANVKPNEYSYLSVLDACERLQKPQLATSLLSDMVKAGLEPTAAHYAFTIGVRKFPCLLLRIWLGNLPV
jgi:pentatricopeptide repeat protein